MWKRHSGFGHSVVIAVLGASSWGGARAAGTADTGSSEAPPHVAKLSEKELVPTLHRINKMEIDAGKLAENNGSSPQAREYGKTLQHDHAAADERLKSVAGELKLALDATIPTAVAHDLDKAMDQVNALESIRGTEFDRRFGEAMAADHKHAIALLNAARPGVTEAKLRTLLDELEPTLRKHERMAESLLKQSRKVSSRETSARTGSRSQ